MCAYVYIIITSSRNRYYRCLKKKLFIFSHVLVRLNFIACCGGDDGADSKLSWALLRDSTPDGEKFQD